MELSSIEHSTSVNESQVDEINELKQIVK